jgi:hypothetical protein
MAERPIILFGEPTPAGKSTRGGGAAKIQFPSHEKQVNRIAPKMEALEKALPTLQQMTAGIEYERTLVFEVAGSTDGFYKAVHAWGDNAEWIFGIPKEFTASDDFYEYKEVKEETEEGENIKRIRRDDKLVIGGKVYCVLTNAQAQREMLQLWKRFQIDHTIKFPHGKGSLKHVFEQLSDIHPWGYAERIEETGILEAWKLDLQDVDLGSVKCEIELFFRNSQVNRQKQEDDLKSRITNLSGSVMSISVIEEIKYHAILAELPRNAVELIIKKDENVSLLTAEQIMFFRPVGQSVYIPDGADAPYDLDVPAADEIIDEPIIALFDGLPQENHPYLINRLIIDDPDGYTAQYQLVDRKHGTSMASLIAPGDLPGTVRQVTHKIYIRPIMKPISGLHETNEQLPDDILIVDKIHEAVRRLFDEKQGAVAKTVKVVNLSIGIEQRQFDRSMSPLARLLDWLSYRYRLLFIVSAGNQIPFKRIWDAGIPFGEYVKLDILKRDETVIKWVADNSRNLRLLSPAESVNSLTVGASFEDNLSFSDDARQLLPCSPEMINPISALGKGINNSIKPDIIYSGGRCVIGESFSHLGSLEWLINWREPGIQSAAPFAPGNNTKTAFTFGASNAAALITHEASRCYDALLDIFSEAQRDIPIEYVALIIKAMLVHGAEWGDLCKKLVQTLEFTNRNQYSDTIHRFIGYGKPDIDWAVECSKKRITLVAYGELNIGEARIYDLPLPFDFSRERIIRRLTATLTYFTPIVPSRQDYRAAMLWFDFPDSKKHLLDSRIEIDWQAARRGSVQHEIFENNDIIAWDEDSIFKIKVNCAADANEQLSDTVPYALLVTFEIKSNINTDVYTKIAEKVHPRVPAN